MTSRFRIITKTENSIRPIDDALKLSDPNDIRDEIEARKRLKMSMVGRLYPPILDDECDKLRSRLNYLNDSVGTR